MFQVQGDLLRLRNKAFGSNTNETLVVITQRVNGRHQPRCRRDIVTPDFQKHVVPLLGSWDAVRPSVMVRSRTRRVRLSLFGFDFQQDHTALLATLGKQNRVNLKSPAKSLMLLKATKSVKHKAEKSLSLIHGNINYHSWIKSGAPGTAIHESNACD